MRLPVRAMALQEASCWEEPICHPSASSSAAASTAPDTPAVGTSSCGHTAEDEEEEWPANPWQAQADAHMLQLRQATTQADAGGLAFGIPAALCSVALQGQQQQQGPDWAPPLLQLRGSADAATQTGDEGSSRLNDLEGQLAVQEDTLARRDQEIRNLRAQLGALGPQHAADAARRRAEVEGLRQSKEELRRRNEFLTAIVSRFEGKTIGLQRQLDDMSAARREAEARAQGEEAAAREAALLREACRAAEAEAGSRAEGLREAEALARELRAAHEEALASAAENREAAESAGVVIRDLKKEHNRKMQDVLRRAERRRQDLGNDRRHVGQEASAQTLPHSEAQAAPPTASCGGAEAQESKEISEPKELKELKDLNMQLVERLAQERSAHQKMQEGLEATSGERETLSSRVDQLSDQLIYLADLNDELREELGAATAACCATMTGVDADRLDAMS